MRNKIRWTEISKSMPPKDAWVDGQGLWREFLLRGEYSIFTGRLFKDGSGFSVPDDVVDSPMAWAIIDGF